MGPQLRDQPLPDFEDEHRRPIEGCLVRCHWTGRVESTVWLYTAGGKKRAVKQQAVPFKFEGKTFRFKYDDGWCAAGEKYVARPAEESEPRIEYDYSDQLRLPDVEPFLAAVHDTLVRFTASLRGLRHEIERAEGATMKTNVVSRKPKKPVYDSLVSKRCRHDQSEWELCACAWRYHVTHGTYTTAEGKVQARKYRGPIPDASSFADAKKKYATIKANIENGRPALHGFAKPGDGQTIEQLGEEWLSQPRGRKASTIRAYRDNLRAHVNPALGSQAVAAVTPEDCERFILAIQPAGKRVKPLTETTRQRIAVTLQALFTFAVERRKRTDNPADGLADVMRDRDVSPDDEVLDPNDHSKYFTAEEVRHLLGVIEEKHSEWYVFVRMAIATGMRMGELAALRYQDINFRDGYVNVTTNYVQGKWTTPKNGKTRTVALPHRLVVLLRHRRRWRRRGPEDLIFPSEAGTPLDVKLFRRRAWKRIMDDAEFEHRTPKAMRHTATTLHLMAGKPIAWVAKQAGRSISETERTYFHFLPTEARSAADELDELVAPRQTRVSRMPATTATNGTDGAVIGRIGRAN